ncbi:MAG: STAS domain-containing protein [Moraxellaceae bacterium]|nr:STAS domain-containing protein [Moraxellaceae bacterium]
MAAVPNATTSSTASTATLTREADCLVLVGALGYDNADQVASAGERLLADGGPACVDLARLESASTLVVAVLLRWARVAANAGKPLQLRHVPAKCQAIIRVSGLDSVLLASGTA